MGHLDRRIARLHRTFSKDGSRRVTDEVFNTWSSSLGAVLAVIGTIALLIPVWHAGKPWHLVSFGLYGLGLVTLFLASALHHGVDGTPATEHKLLVADYCVIFPMIAGSASPFCLILLRNPLGWTVFGLLWAVAIFGFVWKIISPDIPKHYSTALYIGMGWIAVIIFIPIYRAIGLEGVAGLLLGGLLYTTGAFIHLKERPNPIPGRFGFHEIWHCFVLVSSACHYYVIYKYLLPYETPLPMIPA